MIARTRSRPGSVAVNGRVDTGSGLNWWPGGVKPAWRLLLLASWSVSPVLLSAACGNSNTDGQSAAHGGATGSGGAADSAGSSGTAGSARTAGSAGSYSSGASGVGGAPGTSGA